MTVTLTPTADRAIGTEPLGALLADPKGVRRAHPRAVVPVSSDGAGDVLLSEFLAAGGEGTDARIESVARGSAAVILPDVPLPGS